MASARNRCAEWRALAATAKKLNRPECRSKSSGGDDVRETGLEEHCWQLTAKVLLNVFPADAFHEPRDHPRRSIGGRAEICEMKRSVPPEHACNLVECASFVIASQMMNRQRGEHPIK